MEVRKNYITTKISYHICDVCGKPCNVGADGDEYCGDEEHAALHAVWGYNSNNKDGTYSDCDICEHCFTKIEAFIVSLGGKVRHTTQQDWSPKEGIDYVNEQ